MSKGDMLGVKDVAGSLSDLLAKLGEPNGNQWLVALNKFLRKEDPYPATRIREVEMGFMSKEDLRSAIAASGIKYDDLVMSHFPFELSTKPKTIRLLFLSARELGILVSENTSLKRVHETALDLGLLLPSPEVALWLALDYGEQPESQMVIIGSESIIGPNGIPGLYMLKRSTSRARELRFIPFFNPPTFNANCYYWAFGLPSKD
jgi:hypothetical protein